MCHNDENIEHQVTGSTANEIRIEFNFYKNRTFRKCEILFPFSKSAFFIFAVRCSFAKSFFIFRTLSMFLLLSSSFNSSSANIYFSFLPCFYPYINFFFFYFFCNNNSLKSSASSLSLSISPSPSLCHHFPSFLSFLIHLFSFVFIFVIFLLLHLLPVLSVLHLYKNVLVTVS